MGRPTIYDSPMPPAERMPRYRERKPEGRPKPATMSEALAQMTRIPINESGGAPGTAERLEKLADTLASFARNAKRRATRSYAKAIDDWEGDLALLHEEYYGNMFHFWWASTDHGNCP